MKSRFLFAFVVAGIVVPRSSVAGDGNFATSSVLQSGAAVLPYEGTLMLDGAPANGTYAIRFRLYDHPSSTGANNLRYEETQSVAFYGGRFSVAIGTGANTGGVDGTVLQAVRDADRLYLGIEIQDSTSAFVALTGRQAIEAYPYAMVSSNAPNMSVAGTLSVGGTTTISGPLNVGSPINALSLNVTTGVTGNSLTINGLARAQTIAPLFGTVSTSDFPISSLGAGIANDTGSLYNGLVIRGSLRNGVRRVVMEGDVEVRGSQAVSGGMQVTGPLRTSSPPPRTCQTVLTGCRYVLDRPVNYLDTFPDIACNPPNGDFLAGFRMVGTGCPAGNARFQLTCCSFNWTAP